MPPYRNGNFYYATMYLYRLLSGSKDPLFMYFKRSFKDYRT